MLTIDKLSVEHITNQFNAIKLRETGRLVPRDGFYYVRAFEYDKKGVPVIKANWKASNYDAFVEEAVFEIAVSSLHPANPAEKFDFSNIVGRTFQVFNMSLGKTLTHPKGLVQGLWLYEWSQPVIVNRTALVLQLIGAEMTRQPDGRITIACDERYGVDYEEEATRIEESSLTEGEPQNIHDWDYFPDDEFVEDTEPEN